MSDAARIVKENAAAKDPHDVEAVFHPDGYRETAGSGVRQATGEGGLSAEQASRFVGEWSRLWTAPSYDACRPLLHDDVVGRWPGFERPLRGADAYAGQVARVAELVPDIHLWPTAHATEGELLFISWEGTGTVGGRALDLYGIDRFRLRDGRVAESVIAYDLARIASAGSAPVGERAHQPA
ncbi:nuclear transport factor 2 family protein [Pseudonocardia acaciae]|uniref:nuclear transport factor 2 family protein n=1 Tax=Pseudonocardia acaciae TaxID=551276 RepID=UPI000684B383|nr:nuclear transport factor 2 family protein [Pseudonocardia acaciae]